MDRKLEPCAVCSLLSQQGVSLGSKFWLWFAIVWLVSPIDLIPEFLPMIGPLDDAIVAALVLRHILKRTDASVLSEHWHGDPATIAKILRIAGLRERPRRRAAPPR